MSASVCYKTNPCFTFARDKRLKLKTLQTPSVGEYSPDYRRNAVRTPEYGLGSSPRDEHYWMKRLQARSPGPIYHYTLDSDTSSRHHQQKAVSHPLIRGTKM